MNTFIAVVFLFLALLGMFKVTDYGENQAVMVLVLLAISGIYLVKADVADIKKQLERKR